MLSVIADGRRGSLDHNGVQKFSLVFGENDLVLVRTIRVGEKVVLIGGDAVGEVSEVFDDFLRRQMTEMAVRSVDLKTRWKQISFQKRYTIRVGGSLILALSN